ncbi:MAG: 50S ribosomal protein L18 [Bacteroidota bacterium]|jgi:large subunit ribosomal protein L18|nr:50S ribosomal protein L18 [Bacteroidales bacterium]MDI9535557.1 50S ribosomal protein L18 [Bacteroidota bacterium]NLP20314.1 50S ribosomal protein L18 [Bacteroidales bacterium]HNY43426.1 50S ribosomal protein L18 [Bacteroidales bacterium]HOD88542.1 50S ribosomal protein L18 [Bacteroidales bacterium]
MALSYKIERRLRIKRSIRSKVFGTAEKPRMSVFRSNKQISVQVIDDVSARTLVAASSKHKDIAETKATKSQKAAMVGKLIAKLALEAGITQVVFDRNGYLYHGKVKALADGAREGGLKL